MTLEKVKIILSSSYVNNRPYRLLSTMKMENIFQYTRCVYETL